MYILDELEESAAQKPALVTAWNIQTSISASESQDGKRRKARASRMVVMVPEDQSPQAEGCVDDQQATELETVTGEEEDAKFWETLDTEVPLSPKRKRKQRNDSVWSLLRASVVPISYNCTKTKMETWLSDYRQLCIDEMV
jgi:hypothetical protein